MINLSADDLRRQRLAGETVVPVLLLELEVGGVVYRLTDAPRDITVGGEIFERSPDIISTTAPARTVEVDRDIWQITFNDYPDAGATPGRFVFQSQSGPSRVTPGVRALWRGVIWPESLPVSWFAPQTPGIRNVTWLVNSAGNFRLEFYDYTPGPHLVMPVRQALRLTMASGTESISAVGLGDDETEPYIWPLEDASRFQQFLDSLSSSSSSTLTLEYRQPWFRRLTAGGWTGVNLQVSVAFLDADHLELSDALVVYRGKCSGVESTAASSGQIQTRVEFTGPLARVDGEHSRYTTPESQRQADATDTAFRFVHDTRELPWGARD